MNTTQDKRTKMLVVLLAAGLFALVILILGVYLFNQRDIAPPDVPAATEPVVTDWAYGTKNGDIWKNQPNQVLRFTPPTNFDGVVTIEAQWAHSSGKTSCEVQLNEFHKITVPGLNKNITSEDQGDSIDQSDCDEIIKEIEDLGYKPGPFNKPHGDINDDSTWYPAKPVDKITGDWSTAQGDLVVNVDFLGENGPPEEWCNLEDGTRKDSPICNGSHMFRVRVIWSPAEEPSPTPTATLTPTPTNTPTPSPTPQPEKANLGDFVWKDSNRNGIQDTGESGISDVTVELYKDGTTTVLDTTATNETGAYSFLNLDAGDYYVKFLLPSGHDFTGANLGNDDEKDSDANTETGKSPVVSLVAGQTNNSIDAGMVGSFGSIGDCVWLDVNKDGIQDSTETTGVPGVWVVLSNAVEELASTPTDGNGCYLFENLEEGEYSLQFYKDSGYTFSPQSAGSDVCKDSDADSTGATGTIDLASGENDMCWDAGLYYSQPNIKILKSEQADHETALDWQLVPVSTKATFHITVYNNGFTDLENVVVSDEQSPGCSRDVSITDLISSDGVLAVGESVSYSCESEQVYTPFSNLAGVTGDPVDGSETVEDYDYSDVSVEESPAIMIRKSEKANHSTAEDLQNIPSGNKAVFYITVTNIGDVDLINVIVTDELAPGCAKDLSKTLLDTNVPNGFLKVGQEVSYTCELENVTNNFTNVAKVTGSSLEETVTDEDDSKVTVYTVPGVTLTPNIPSLPNTGILDDGRWKAVIPAVGVLLLGVGFVALGGNKYVGKLMTKGSNDKGVLD